MHNNSPTPLAEEILDCFVVINTDQMGNARYDVNFNQLAKAIQSDKQQAVEEERALRDKMLDDLRGFLTTPGKVYFQTIIEARRTLERLQKEQQ